MEGFASPSRLFDGNSGDAENCQCDTGGAVWSRNGIATGDREGKTVTEHPNVARLKDGYTAFAKGDFAALNDLFAEDVLWHEGGRNQLAGEYRGREAVYGFFGKLMEVTEGSFHLDLHAVLADDEHGVALVVTTASRGGRSITVNDAHVFHLRDGKVVEFFAASTDQYASDELIG
jgi:ketosteroid isomerase-like protein